MKQIIFLAVFALVTFKSHAKLKIPVCIPCEKIDMVTDLPNDENLKEGGDYLNLGYLHKEFGVVYIPAWNSDGKYVLTNENEDVYYELSEEDLEKLKETYNLEISSNPLSFWKKIGGKIIYLGLIGFVIWGYLSKDDENDE